MMKRDHYQQHLGPDDDEDEQRPVSKWKLYIRMAERKKS
jgi:hypothetical protein